MKKTAKKQNRDLDFLYEMGRLRFTQRSWQRFFLTRVANDTEHTFRVMWLALIIARQEKNCDDCKTVKMALAHDIAESRAGDVDYLSRLYATRDENLAIRDMFSQTSIGGEFVALIEEYEKRQSIEAKIVKDADNLDIDLELMEQRDTNPKLFELKSSARKKIIPKKLHTKTAQLMFREIYASDVHNWHFNSENNRFKTGDWKK